MTAPGTGTAVPYDRTKRALDVALTLIALVLLAPVLAVLAWRVRRELGSPVLFRQTRPGLHGRPFELRKFRTMTDQRDADGQLLPDDQRLTPFGAWLRSTSLDELPELLNVLRGDMSLVGPRPLLMAYLERYSPHQARRHEVRPGITGWAQVNGRNDLPWPDKLDLDVWYVDHRSLILDVRILLKTLWVMVRRDGVALDGHATTVEFRGETHDRPDGAASPPDPDPTDGPGRAPGPGTAGPGAGGPAGEGRP